MIGCQFWISKELKLFKEEAQKEIRLAKEDAARDVATAKIGCNIFKLHCKNKTPDEIAKDLNLSIEYVLSILNEE